MIAEGRGEWERELRRWAAGYRAMHPSRGDVVSAPRNDACLMDSGRYAELRVQDVEALLDSAERTRAALRELRDRLEGDAQVKESDADDLGDDAVEVRLFLLASAAGIRAAIRQVEETLGGLS